MVWVGGSSKITIPDGISMPDLMISSTPPLPEMNVSRSLQSPLDVLVAAHRVEVVRLVVVERRLLAKTREHRVRIGVDLDVVGVPVQACVRDRHRGDLAAGVKTSGSGSTQRTGALFR